MEQIAKALYSPEEAATALNFCKATLYQYMARGAIQYVMLGARRKITAEEIARIKSEGLPPLKDLPKPDKKVGRFGRPLETAPEAA